MLTYSVIALAVAVAAPTKLSLDNGKEAVLIGTEIGNYGGGGLCLRSGEPKTLTSATFIQVLNIGSTIDSVAFAYSYETGFNGPTGSSFSLDVGGKAAYTSPVLTDHSYTKSVQCLSYYFFLLASASAHRNPEMLQLMALQRLVIL